MNIRLIDKNSDSLLADHDAKRQFGGLRPRSRVVLALNWMLAICLYVAVNAATAATTYYVRTDGGDADQCTGLADNAYPGTGAAQACAWKHPFFALPPTGAPRMVGGDTLIIGPGEYMMGYGAPGAPINSSSGYCYAAGAYGCVMAPIPSGPSPTEKTRILGKGFDQGCPAKPQLWGAEHAWYIINLDHSSNVEIGCLELTDHSDCIEFHCANGNCQGGSSQIAQCNRTTPPFGPWAGTAIHAAGASVVYLHDLNIHGMANRGVEAGGLDNWMVRRVVIRANGWAGWDGDIGEGSSNVGTVTFQHAEIAWNGCGERYPSGEIFGCWAQVEGGYGDGLGTASTGGNWVIEDSWVHHNTSDGIDLLYANGSGGVIIRRTRSEGNAGNQIKAAGSTSIDNSVIVGNCAYFDGRYNMSAGDQCRALGDAVDINLNGNGYPVNVDLSYNTITGEGNCLVVTENGDANARVNMANNALIGASSYWHRVHNPGETPQQSACAQYSQDSAAPVAFARNLLWQTRDDGFIPDSIRTDPGIVSTDMANFSALPVGDSALIDAADPIYTIAVDQRGVARPVGAGYDIGALEYQGESDDVVYSAGFD